MESIPFFDIITFAIVVVNILKKKNVNVHMNQTFFCANVTIKFVFLLFWTLHKSNKIAAPYVVPGLTGHAPGDLWVRVPPASI